jgi:hypothetical protein
MSDRGSFATEYIYCTDCLEVVRKALFAPNDYLRYVQQVHDPERGTPLPIFTGMVKSYGGGMELIEMGSIMGHLHHELCHPVRIAVLAENGQNIFAAGPGVDPDEPVALSPWG